MKLPYDANVDNQQHHDSKVQARIGANLWVDDFVASLVKEGQQLLMHRGLL